MRRIILPKYVYYCKECDQDFETKHSLQETCSMCKICGYEDTLVRRPSTIFLTQKTAELKGKSEPGGIIKATIEETRQDIRNEQEQLRKRVYKK